MTTKKFLRNALLVFTIWTAYGLFSIYQSYLFSKFVSPRDWMVIVKASLSMVWIWAVFTPAIVWLARHLRLTRERWATRLPVHMALFFFFNLLDVAVDFLLRPMIGWPPPDRPYRTALFLQMDANFANYLGVVAITHAVDFQRWYKERRERAAQLELQTAQLESQLTRARLDALKMQLHPHFLYNTLHAISELIHEDPRTAERMVTHLGELLRMALDDAERQEVPLHEEMAFIHAYLDIERCRHLERFKVETDLPPETLGALVPHLILQPLVENAIRHGVSSRLNDSRLRIAAARENGNLVVEIDDNGVGLPSEGQIREGVGLRNTRARLAALYGDTFDLRLLSRKEGGTRARLAVPFRPAPPDTCDQRNWTNESTPLEARRMGPVSGASV
jgi:two-component system, LytTR family, sensor kinase